MLAAALALFLVPALLSILRQTQTVHAATITVDTPIDENDGSCVGGCSLRDAITIAVAGDTILIPPGTYPLSDTLGELSVSKTLIFSGTGSTAADVVIEAGANARLFAVASGTATFFNLTLQGGSPTSGNGGAVNATGGANLIVDSAVITNNQTAARGGGIALANGSLTLTNSQILSNTAGGDGGGVFTNNGLITLNNSQVMTNTAVNSGGGIALNLANASLIMNSGQVNDNVANTTAGFPGGGISVAQGSATINDGEIRNNLAYRGGGLLVSGGLAGGSITLNGGQVIDNEATYGGGIYVQNQTAMLTINDGEITQNRSVSPATFGGGGLYLFQGLVTMNGGEISFNTALNDGGAVEIGDPAGRFIQTGGEILNNSAGNNGGAIYNSQGVLNINNGSIYLNNSTAEGGGIYTGVGSSNTIASSAILTNTTSGSTGGGIHNAGSLTMTNVTLSGNSANSGAGLWNSGTAVLTNVTLSENSAINNGGGLSSSGGMLTVGNSIIYGNTAPSGADCNGTITSAGNNISTCGLGGSGDISDPPQLQPLALNNGGTLNYALAAASPAIDAGSNTLCPAADQRGNLRPIDGNGDSTAACDIGAYEYGIGFFISDASLTEGDAGNTQMSFIVSRSFITDTTYTVDYETITGTATADVDFTHVPTATLTFLPATMTQTVNINIVGDTMDENDEQFTVQLSNQSAEVGVGDFSGTGTILDDDDPPSLTISDTTVTEGDSGTATAVFTATLSAPSGKTITVNYDTQDGTAVAGTDYVAVANGTLTFTPGDTEKTFNITVNGDSLDEFDETFTVVLSNESNVTLADSSGQTTISDDDDPPTVSLADANVTEGNSGTASMDFLVTLSAPSGKTVTVDYMTAAGSATAGVDYDIASNSVTFTPGDTAETISVTVNGDAIDEVNETFLVNLSNESNATILDGEATGTINDDDPLPTATISNATVIEGDTGTVTAVFTVTLSAASEKTITINYSGADDTATAGEDYTAVPASVLTFNPGDPLFKTISVTVQGDEATETDEQFFINLTGSSNVTLGNNQAIGTITDDDGSFIYLPFIIAP